MKKKSSDHHFDLFILKFCLILVLTLTIPGYFLLKPTNAEYDQSIQKTKEFAKFIEDKPNFLHINKVKPKRSRLPFQDSTPTVSETTQFVAAIIRDVNDSEKIEIKNILLEWQNPSLDHNEQWKQQVEKIFEIAEQTHQPEVLDLLRRELVRSKSDTNPITIRLFENWKLEYLKLDSRKASVIELE